MVRPDTHKIAERKEERKDNCKHLESDKVIERK
jgi:hypothetical protein